MVARTLKQFKALFLITVREQLREKILWIGFLLGVGVLAFVISVSRFSFILESRLLLNSGGFFLDASAIVLGLLLSSKVYAHDLETRMFDLIFIRNVSPVAYVLGRSFGLTGAVGLSNAILAFIVAVYLAIIGQPEWMGVGLLWFTSLLKGACVGLWALVLSFRFKPFVTGLLTLIAVWVSAQEVVHQGYQDVLQFLFPAMRVFDFSDEVLYGFPISIWWVLGGLLQVFAWIVLWSVIANILFKYRRTFA